MSPSVDNFYDMHDYDYNNSNSFSLHSQPPVGFSGEQVQISRKFWLDFPDFRIILSARH